jgi:hypothetical protein
LQVPLNKNQSNSLFGELDDEEDELFGSSAKSKPTPKPTQSKSVPKPSKSQDFDDPLLGGGF